MRAQQRETQTTSGRRPSEAIRWFAYDAAAERLYVTFPEGRSYVYSPLTFTAYARFYEAPSRGTYLNTVIKPMCDCQEVDQIPSELHRERG